MLSWAHPVVSEWFTRRFGTPTEPQVEGWPHILAGRSTLISAPTGSGKTLAAFLACIDALVRRAHAGELTDRTDVLYISPLKALGNDIQKNLEGPLAEIVELAREQGQPIPEIRTAVRTGDTLMHARRAMLKRPPHILVTTPESLYILLTSERSREILKSVRTVIVDEIHAMADDKRGAHLTLSLERLEALAGVPLTRIGLSATQKPIELVAKFLSGAGRPDPIVVQVSPRRVLDLAIETPPSEMGAVATNELWNEIYDRIATLVREHKSTLVFVNTRRLAERVTHHLSERLGADLVAAHHGSLSRKTRLDAERRLKAGELRALVATASLELGIDVGSIELVCQVGSPRSLAVAVQRIGRAGHWRGAVPKGRLFPTTRDDLVECSALILGIRRGELDRLIVPHAPLDILAQQIVATCASEEWRTDDLFDLVRRAHPYRDLTRVEFDEIVEMLAQGIAARRGRYGAYLFHDRVNGRVRARRGARLVAITSGGAIPETGLYTVVAEPEGTVIGTVDEDFAVESMAGDVMLLGNTSWRIRRVSIAGRVLVEDAHGASPTIPFWRGEAPARTPELSVHVAEVRETVSRLAPTARPGSASDPPGVSEPHPGSADQAIRWAMEQCGLSRAGAEQLVDYIVTARTVLGTVPTQQTIVAERFFDEGGGMQLIIHAPFGARINKAWGLALRKRFCRSFNFELQAAATDNGINIALAEQHSFPLIDVFQFLRPASAREVLEQAALASPFFGSRWRWDASRALALPRFQHGKKVPIHLLRLRSDDLLASVFPDVAACQENIEGDIKIPDHPLVREVMKDVLTEAMDVDGFLDLLKAIDEGRVKCVAVDTPVPSVFSHEILNANPYAFLDDAPLEERRARAVQLRRTLPQTVLEEIGKLDPEAIAEVCRDAWPDVRDADDLHDAMQTMIVVPQPVRRADLSGPLDNAGPERPGLRTEENEHWPALFDALARDRRAGVATRDGLTYWVPAERAKTFTTIFPDASFDTPLPDVDTDTRSREEAVAAMVQGWLSHLGPVTAARLAARLGLITDDVDAALLRIEATGAVLRGKFTGARMEAGSSDPADPAGLKSRPPSDLEWCDRRLLARIHRLTLGRLRREIAPVTSADFMRWLLTWQHVAPGSQAAADEHGVLEVVHQLQGFEAPSSAWERHLLRSRVRGYDPEMLDGLCLAGTLGWGRLSPHPATLEANAGGPRRVIPTSAAPITFFVREDADWMPVPGRASGDPAEKHHLSPPARDVLHVLHRAGASFFADIVRGSRRLRSEVEAALWELVAAGLVTADGFDNLRALIDPRRRAGQGSSRDARPRHSTGRWTLLSGHFELPAEGHQMEAGSSDPVRGRASAACQMLLRRYGIVFRELLSRESLLPPWRELLIAFRRMEDRGELRGGRFVSGFIGEQFALATAVESLRAQRHRAPTGDVVTVAAADPLNLVGVILPGERVAANSGKLVSFKDGVPVETEDRVVRSVAG